MAAPPRDALEAEKAAAVTRMLRSSLRFVLKSAGLLGAARQLRRNSGAWYRFVRQPESRRRAQAERQRLQHFKAQHGSVLARSMGAAGGHKKKVLIMSRLFRHMETQLAMIKALELAGFQPVVLIAPNQRQVNDCLRWAGVEEIREWSTFVDRLDFSADADQFVATCGSMDDLLAFEHAGSRCGRVAASTTIRQLRTGTLDLKSPQVRSVLGNRLASAMASATAARAVLRQVRPQLMLSSDVEYTPGSELFDNCLDNGIDIVTYRAGHRNNTLLLKRYSSGNRDQNPVSLSDESWELLKAMEWSEARRTELRDELFDCYSSANWYGSAGTQFNTRLVDASAIRSRLGLARGKKTAFIFPHIPWDAPLRWGRDLFPSSEKWLVETVRAASYNDNVNWIIKIHPANVGKRSEEGGRETAEMATLRRHFGQLPAHVSVIPPDSDISTYSLYEVMDYCVTVRGTVGIEAASFGIPVITAGTGRYEGKGFTTDPGSREQYLDRIARIHEIGRLSLAKQELAERFAYGIFLRRPLPLRAISLEFSDEPGTEAGFTRTRLNITTRDGWNHAPDLRALAQWIGNARNPDFLNESDAR